MSTTTDKPWNGICPNCGDTRSYQGFFEWLCPNPTCKRFDETQCELVTNVLRQEEEEKLYDAQIDIDQEKNETNVDEEGLPDTIPYYPVAVGPQPQRTSQAGPIPDPDDSDDDDDSNNVQSFPNINDLFDQDNFGFGFI